MIPKRAIFYWEGPPMSWLRQQSISTFSALNPGWEVVTITGEPTTSFTKRVHQSDRERYRALHEMGGIYFDTDMVFVRPIPEEWLSVDAIIPIDIDGGRNSLYSVAMLGSSEGNVFWKYCTDYANRMLSDNKIYNPQAFGIRLVSEVLKATAKMERGSILAIPHTTHLTEDWSNVERLWWDCPLRIMSDTVAVHWYGGDRVSEEMEALGENLPECQVLKAIRMSERCLV